MAMDEKAAAFEQFNCAVVRIKAALENDNSEMFDCRER
jgi:hypothetical protein